MLMTPLVAYDPDKEALAQLMGAAKAVVATLGGDYESVGFVVTFDSSGHITPHLDVQPDISGLPGPIELNGTFLLRGWEAVERAGLSDVQGLAVLSWGFELPPKFNLVTHQHDKQGIGFLLEASLATDRNHLRSRPGSPLGHFNLRPQRVVGQSVVPHGLYAEEQQRSACADYGQVIDGRVSWGDLTYKPGQHLSSFRFKRPLLESFRARFEVLQGAEQHLLELLADGGTPCFVGVLESPGYFESIWLSHSAYRNQRTTEAEVTMSNVGEVVSVLRGIRWDVRTRKYKGLEQYARLNQLESKDSPYEATAYVHSLLLDDEMVYVMQAFSQVPDASNQHLDNHFVRVVRVADGVIEHLEPDAYAPPLVG